MSLNHRIVVVNLCMVAAEAAVVSVTICRHCGGHLTGTDRNAYGDWTDSVQILKGGLLATRWFGIVLKSLQVQDIKLDLSVSCVR